MDTLLVRRDDGTIKLLVYRKPTHTDQYWAFDSHHPLHKKLGVVRTLLDRKERVVSEDVDKIREEEHIRQALSRCGYPKWTVDKVKNDIKRKEEEKTKRRGKKENENKIRGMIVIPYVKLRIVGSSQQSVSQTWSLTTAMRPHCTLRRLLGHPKDKQDKNKVCESVYRIPCKNCEKAYIGDTGRSLCTQVNVLQVWRTCALLSDVAQVTSGVPMVCMGAETEK